MKRLIFLHALFFLMLFQINSQAQIFHEDFEIADSVSYSSNSSADWGQNNRLFTSGSFCDSASIQDPGDIITMTTMPFSTVGMDSVILYFNQICKVEFFDDCIIEVSNDSGLTWVTLADNSFGTGNCDYYGASMFAPQSNKFHETSYAAWLPGMVATPEFSWWRREIFDVSILLSNSTNALVRFVIKDQNNNGGNYRSGWFIDDIEVQETLYQYLYTFQNRVSGKIYLDMNSNLVHDVSEPPLNLIFVNQLSTPYVGCSFMDGYYIVYTPTVGLLDIQPDTTLLNNPNFNVAPNMHSVTFTTLGQIDSLNHFAVQPIINADNLLIQLSEMQFCNSAYSLANYLIFVKNTGSTVINPTIVFYPSNQLTFDSSSVTPSLITNDSIVWSLGPLYPFGSEFIIVQMNKPFGLPYGTLITSHTKVEPLINDIDVTNNFSYDTTVICGSWDPNKIEVDKEILTPFDISSSTYLNYTIYFQNTGNDSAINVRIENLIPPELDLGTFEVIYYSHNIQLDYNYLAHPRLMSFVFNDIYLPDSSTNEPESHGFVKYRIKPLSNLVVGDSILNNASIFFDYNPPIVTNTAITEIVDPTSLEEMTLHNNWSVFPNPVNSELNINYEMSTEENVTIEIFNLYCQKINVLLDEKAVTGLHQHKFNMTSLSNGVYLIQFLAGDSRQVRKFVKVD